MWTSATRRQHHRDGSRYETDLTDAEWALIEPLLPPPPEYGRPRFWSVREIMNAIFSRIPQMTSALDTAQGQMPLSAIRLPGRTWWKCDRRPGESRNQRFRQAFHGLRPC